MTTKKNKQNYVKPSVMVVELMEPATLLQASAKIVTESNNAEVSVNYEEESWGTPVFE